MGELGGGMMKRLKRRKEIEEDFSDFSLSFPATKIRRLDAELSSIMEEEEIAGPFVPPAQHIPDSIWQVRNSGVVIEELPNESENEERALILFKPVNSIHSPKSFSVSVDPNLLSRINYDIWSNKSALVESSEDDSTDHSKTGDKCLAVVPWVPSKIPSAPENEVPDLMEADDVGVTSMDIEEENGSVNRVQAHVCHSNDVPNPGQELHQWQQHCFIPPQVPQNASSPIMYYR